MKMHCFSTPVSQHLFFNTCFSTHFFSELEEKHNFAISGNRKGNF